MILIFFISYTYILRLACKWSRDQYPVPPKTYLILSKSYTSACFSYLFLLTYSLKRISRHIFQFYFLFRYVFLGRQEYELLWLCLQDQVHIQAAFELFHGVTTGSFNQWIENGNPTCRLRRRAIIILPSSTCTVVFIYDHRIRKISQFFALFSKKLSYLVIFNEK